MADDEPERERRRRAAAPPQTQAPGPRAAVPGRRDTQQLWADVQTGVVPSHNYGLASARFGANLSYAEANAYVQRFNAPTREALLGRGNDPAASRGTVMRPGAGYMPAPLDHGGNVTLEHGDGVALNRTIPFQHPLEGTITRNLVTDLHPGAGYQVLTLGQGRGGAQLATTAGGAIGGVPGAIGARNASHAMNPELGRTAFGALDQSMIAAANGEPNPNGRGGPLTEMWHGLRAAGAGAAQALGFGGEAMTSDPQQQAVYDLARQLNAAGPVTGSFVRSSVLPGVYYMTPTGSQYFERDPDGRMVPAVPDDGSGL